MQTGVADAASRVMARQFSLLNLVTATKAGARDYIGRREFIGLQILCPRRAGLTCYRVRWNPNFFPIPNTLNTESHPVKACRNNRSLQTASPSTCLRTLIL